MQLHRSHLDVSCSVFLQLIFHSIYSVDHRQLHVVVCAEPVNCEFCANVNLGCLNEMDSWMHSKQSETRMQCDRNYMNITQVSI